MQVNASPLQKCRQKVYEMGQHKHRTFAELKHHDPEFAMILLENDRFLALYPEFFKASLQTLSEITKPRQTKKKVVAKKTICTLPVKPSTKASQKKPKTKPAQPIEPKLTTKPKKRMTWNSGGSGIVSQLVPHSEPDADTIKFDGKHDNT